MEMFNSLIEGLNAMVGLQYAGYGPITALFIGIFTVAVSIKVLKFFFKPFAPLFQTAAELGESNPVLAQQGIRDSQIQDERSDPRILNRFERSRERTSKTRDKFKLSRREELFDEAPEEHLAANDSQGLDFAEALEEAWQDDQTSEMRAAIAPLRAIQPQSARAGSKGEAAADNVAAFTRDMRPTAATTATPACATPTCATPTCATMSGNDLPVIRITNFGEFSKSSGAANRIAVRLGQGVTETLGRIPNLAVETATDTLSSTASSNEPVFNVEGMVDLQKDGVRISISVFSTFDGSQVLTRQMTCGPSEIQTFEKEVALEIASAVIAHQRSSGHSVMGSLTAHRDEQAGSKYPSVRRPSPEHPRRTDRPGL